MRSCSTNRYEPLLQSSIYDQQYLPTAEENEPHFETPDRSREVTTKEKQHLRYNSPYDTDLYFKILYQ